MSIFQINKFLRRPLSNIEIARLGRLYKKMQRRKGMIFPGSFYAMRFNSVEEFFALVRTIEEFQLEMEGKNER